MKLRLRFRQEFRPGALRTLDEELAAVINAMEKGDLLGSSRGWLFLYLDCHDDVLSRLLESLCRFGG